MARIVTVPPGLESKLGIYTYGPIPGMTRLDLDQAISDNGFDVENCPNLVAIHAPNMTDVDPLGACGGYIYVSNCAALTTVDLPSLQTSFGGLDLRDCPLLVSGSLPALISAGDLNITNTGLPSLVVPNFTTSLRVIVSGNLALTLASVPVWTAGGKNSVLQHIGNPQCVQLDARAATFIDSLYIGVTVGNTPADGSLTTVRLDSLTSAGLIQIQQCNALATLSFPQLGPAVTTSVNISFNPSLANVSMPNWTPSNNQQVAFIDCALTAASVNHILARCVANPGYVSGPVALYGGTSAAPTGQGITDKNTLSGRGVSVVTN